MSDKRAAGRPLTVECVTDGQAEHGPQRFVLGQRTVQVDEIVDRWLEDPHSYFKLRGDDDCIYILRHDNATSTWELILFDSGRCAETRLSST